MACCIIGALIIAHVLAFWRRVKSGARFAWAATSVVAAAGLIGFGVTEAALAVSDGSATRILGWCVS